MMNVQVARLSLKLVCGIVLTLSAFDDFIKSVNILHLFLVSSTFVFAFSTFAVFISSTKKNCDKWFACMVSDEHKRKRILHTLRQTREDIRNAYCDRGRNNI